MSDDLQQRVQKLDDKQAMHYLAIIASGVPASTEDALGQLRNCAAKANTFLPPNLVADPEDLLLEGRTAGDLARSLLGTVSLSVAGSQIVEAALEQKPSTTADFGVISGPVLLLVAWLAVSGQMTVTIKGLKYHKEGITPADQFKLVKSVIPTIVKALT